MSFTPTKQPSNKGAELGQAQPGRVIIDCIQFPSFKFGTFPSFKFRTDIMHRNLLKLSRNKQNLYPNLPLHFNPPNNELLLNYSALFFLNPI